MSLFASSSRHCHPSAVSSSQGTIISVLDLGSSKMCCLIAKLRPQENGGVLPGRTHSIELLGFGHQRSAGIKSGTVVDMDAAERSLRLAVDAAERSAGLTVDQLIVSVSAGRLSSDSYASSIRLDGNAVDEVDVKDVLAEVHESASHEARTTLHAMPVDYTLDGAAGIADPIGLVGEELGVAMTVTSADDGPLQNLENCINRTHLSVQSMVAAPYASGLACLVADEMQMGCVCIDMGAGTTTISIFLNGQMVFADAIAVGGQHVTMDIARTLSTRVADAERMKVLHGKAVANTTDEGDMLAIPTLNDDPHVMPQQISIAQLSQIIGPRVEETLELIRDRIARSGLGPAVGRRVVLTGGASQLAGAADVAARVLDADIRLGRPLGVSRLPQNAKGSAFSAAAGLLVHPQIAGREYYPRQSAYRPRLGGVGDGALSRVSRWFKDAI
ncbi:MAG: cell division protein FtsA [Pseudomonadota bacterium]